MLIEGSRGLDELLRKGIALAKRRFPDCRLELCHWLDPEESRDGEIFIEIWTSLKPFEIKSRFYEFIRRDFMDVYLASDGKLAPTVRFE